MTTTVTGRVVGRGYDCPCRGCVALRDSDGLVREAAARLDAAAPDWYRRVRPLTLDLNSGERCVLGQVFGSYPAGLRALRVPGSDVVGLAFTGAVSRDLWLAEVDRRLAADADGDDRVCDAAPRVRRSLPTLVGTSA